MKDTQNNKRTRRKTNNPASKFSKLINGSKLPTPKHLMKYLNERVIGQEETKKRISVAVYNHYKRTASNLFGLGNDDGFADVSIDKSNILMLGGSGTGKTFIIQNIAKILGVPCYIHDCTKLTESGHFGEDVGNILTGLLMEANFDPERAEIGIVCLDAFDKLAMTGSSMSLGRDVRCESVQQRLLKIVEGSVVSVLPIPEEPLIPIDTTNILFIGMGAFCGLEKIIEKRTSKSSRIGFGKHDDIVANCASNNILDEVMPTDLKNFGFIPELIGRFPVITHTNPLKKDDLVRIIQEPKNSIIKQYQKLAYIDGKSLLFTDEAIDSIADAAILSETGARGIRGILETVLNDFMFESADPETTNLIIDKEYTEKSLHRIFKQFEDTSDNNQVA